MLQRLLVTLPVLLFAVTAAAQTNKVPCQCFDDDDCASGEVCEIAWCTCVPADDADTCHACLDDSDCAGGFACIPDESGCNLCQVRDIAIACNCSGDDECPTGQACDYALGDNETCGLCADVECECDSDLDCDANSYCDDDTCGRCVDKSQLHDEDSSDAGPEETQIGEVNPLGPGCVCATDARASGDVALLGLASALVGRTARARRRRSLDA